MSGSLRLRLPPEPRAPRVARRALEEVDGLDDEVRATAALLTSELVTNAVRHACLAAHERIEVTISVGSVLRVEVAEPGPGPIGIRPASGPKDEHGRGLVMVARLARRWGIDREQPGRVWFELALGSANGDGHRAVRPR
jgi:two-component sensor histidine kinase